MNINRRKGVITLPTTPAVKISIDVLIDTWARLMTADVDLITNNSILSNSNTELVAGTKATITLDDVDPAVLGRFTLASANKFPHTDLDVMVFYDHKYSDYFVVPSLEIYKAMTYLAAVPIQVRAYGVNFSGKPGGTVPVPVFTQDITAEIVKLPRDVNTVKRDGYYETMLTPTLNHQANSSTPTALLNFGTPATLFTTLNFSVDMCVMGYDSLFQWTPISVGNQVLVNAGTLVVPLPV